jgi:transcriptional regulator with XRE-family HTH domain
MLAHRRNFSPMAMDSPLRRWRHQHHLSQAALAACCEVRPDTISRYEQGTRTPRGEELERLMDVTGLPADALVLPRRYLRDHPEFLAAWATEPPRRGRPRKRPPGEGPAQA